MLSLPARVEPLEVVLAPYGFTMTSLPRHTKITEMMIYESHISEVAKNIGLLFENSMSDVEEYAGVLHASLGLCSTLEPVSKRERWLCGFEFYERAQQAFPVDYRVVAGALNRWAIINYNPALLSNQEIVFLPQTSTAEYFQSIRTAVENRLGSYMGGVLLYVCKQPDGVRSVLSATLTEAEGRN